MYNDLSRVRLILRGWKIRIIKEENCNMMPAVFFLLFFSIVNAGVLHKNINGTELYDELQFLKGQFNNLSVELETERAIRKGLEQKLTEFQTSWKVSNNDTLQQIMNLQDRYFVMQTNASTSNKAIRDELQHSLNKVQTLFVEKLHQAQSSWNQSQRITNNHIKLLKDITVQLQQNLTKDKGTTLKNLQQLTLSISGVNHSVVAVDQTASVLNSSFLSLNRRFASTYMHTSLHFIVYLHRMT